jgi:hypothetical protein
MKRLGKRDNEQKEELARAIADTFSDFQAALEAAHEWVSVIHERAEAFYDERSERWQDSDAGLAYAEWRDEMDRILGLITTAIGVENPSEDLASIPEGPEEA